MGERTREIGLRMALGATRRDVLGLVAGSGLGLVAAGVLLGLTGALLTIGALASMLFETTTRDPLTLLAASAILGATAGLASRRAAQREGTRSRHCAATDRTSTGGQPAQDSAFTGGRRVAALRCLNKCAVVVSLDQGRWPS